MTTAIHRGPGRPRLARDVKREVRVELRLTRGEHQILSTTATQQGRSLSEMVREAALAVAARTKSPAK